jgi:type 1 fimbria pilin
MSMRAAAAAAAAAAAVATPPAAAAAVHSTLGWDMFRIKILSQPQCQVLVCSCTAQLPLGLVSRLTLAGAAGQRGLLAWVGMRFAIINYD